MTIAWGLSEMSEKKSERKMSVLCEASGLVRQIAAPATGKAALLLASRRLGTWTYNRVKDVYYADKRVKISGEEIDGLRAMTRKETVSSDPSITELRDQLAVVVRHLQRIDPTFRDPMSEALSRAARTETLAAKHRAPFDDAVPF